jgi:hypothetical protein
MPGGPISGVPKYAAINAGLAPIDVAFSDGADDVRGIVVPTLLQISADAVSYWTSMTCLYNRWWYPLSDKMTMPIAMFHVKKITETQQNEISKKRVMLYEPQLSETGGQPDDRLREGVMQTIVDNIVKQPKTYSMEIIVPFQPVGRYVGEGVQTLSSMLTSFINLLGGDNTAVQHAADILAAWFSIPATAAKAAEQVANLASVFGFSGTDGAGMINKNSLEAMADSGKVLCMKMWTGYDYKFVSITSLSFDKDPKEDDVFRATMQLQEMPVLQVTPRPEAPKDTLTRGWRQQAISAVMGLLAKPLVFLTNVDHASGDGPANMVRRSW